MEHLTDPRNFSRDGSVDHQGTKLRDFLVTQKQPNFSYADFRHQVKRNPEERLPKYIGSQKSRVLERTNPKEDEVVRYMSNLPSYLEKGKNIQEKALNFGVLDWGSLEKWQYNKKQMPNKYIEYSPSSTTTSTSLFSIETSSSTHSSRGHSRSPARQRMHHPLQSHSQMAYARKEKFQDIDVCQGNSGKFQDSGKLQRHERRESRLSLDKYELVAPWKGKSNIQAKKSSKDIPRLQETNANAFDRGCSGRMANPSEDLGARKSSELVTKARNPSPIRRLSSAMGKMIKNGGSRDNSPVRRSSSKDVFIDPSGCDKLSTTSNRGRSSPLRRFLDPILKPRVSNSTVPLKKHSCSMIGTTKSCNEEFDFGSSSLRALLRVSFKNGLPFFTFAIDNAIDILAATVRKSSAEGKGHDNWTYTFFNVREIKRKSGIWSNQGGKGNGQGYAPNILAQMKVLDSRGSPNDHHITREFDLFAVDVGHPTNELAAIVVELPRVNCENPSKDGQSSYNWLDSLETCLREDLENQNSHESMNLSTTVILPGGVHTTPSKGDISTLVQRWRSGGSCDCGGWDLGCQLRVFSNQREYERQRGSSITCLNEFNKFQLFSQAGQDNLLVFSLVPFKERIYSVEFNSSLSPLQAFAICMSFIDHRRPPEPSDPSNEVEKITKEVGVFRAPIQMKTSSNQVQTPAKYVSYPPHSPVGRV